MQADNRLEQYSVGDACFFYRPDSYDRFMIEEVWEKDEYALSSIDFLPDGVIVDIGAQIGAFSIKMSRKFPEHTIFAFEPDVDNYHILLKNIALNKCLNIQAFQKAIFNAAKKTKLFIDENHTGGHSLLPGFHNGKKQVDVETIALNDIPVNAVSYLKIDCEGAEYQIIASISDVLWKNINFLAVEFHPVPGFDALNTIAEIQQRNFRPIRQKAGYMPGQYTVIFILDSFY